MRSRTRRISVDRQVARRSFSSGQRCGWRRRRVPVGGCLLAVLIAAHVSAEDEPGRYAVLVGVSRYESPDLDLLRYPENDVVELAQVLRDAGFPSADVKVMTETNAVGSSSLRPTGVNIRRELENLVSRAK
ncbi:MAG: caspase family protein, partial [Planctomycetaceae bacterium]|nr:caspase family protein [Planctomycetaceae bacterium]